MFQINPTAVIVVLLLLLLLSVLRRLLFGPRKAGQKKSPSESPADEDSRRRWIVAFVERHLPKIGDSMVCESSYDKELGSVHFTLVRVTRSQAVLVVTGQLFIARTVIDLATGHLMTVTYKSIQEVDFCSLDVYGGDRPPLHAVVETLSALEGLQKCSVEACVMCARLREALAKLDVAGDSSAPC